jgi:TRAP-type C4-dicarboxylate transport system substrate-binding protein
MSDNEPRRELTRRELFSITAKYGAKAALYAIFCQTTLGFVPSLSKFVMNDANAASKAKYNLRYGATVISKANEPRFQTKAYRFVELVEQMSEGEVSIQVLDARSACAEANCGTRVANGVLDMGNSSAQNLAAVLPYAIALDFTYLWKDRTGFYNMLFSKESEKLYRGVFRSRYGIEPLFGNGDMRGLFMGLKYKDKPPIRSPEQLKGAKLRITNSEPIRAFGQGIGMNPIPLAFVETLEGLKSGIVDAAEIYAGPATMAGMHKVCSQWVALDFCPGFEMCFISSAVFDKFPDRIKEIFYEAAWQAMKEGYTGVLEANNKLVGVGPDPASDSDFLSAGIKNVRFTQEELEPFKALSAADRRPELYSDVRKKLDKLAGLDILGALQEYEATISGKGLIPEKWWT